MTSALRKLHIQAVSEVVELALIASMIALIADTAWVLHDIKHNGMNVMYGVIVSSLLSATLITGVACYKHHKNNFRRLYKDTLEEKLDLQYCKNRYYRRCNK